MTSSSGKRKRYAPDVHFGELLGKGPSISVQEPELELHSEDCEDSSASEARPRKREKLEGKIPVPLPPTSRYLPIVIGGSHWRGRESLENVVVVGDSYSKSNEGETWVDHLRTRLQKHKNPARIHNFAFPGATVEDDLSAQLSRFFTTFPKKDSPHDTPTLDPDRATYFLFFGINDCGSTESDELEPIVEMIFDAVHNFYVKAGARNFVLVDVPPIDRSPQATDSGSSDEIETRVRTWNDLLKVQTAEFGASSKEATTLLFSSHQVLTEVLEDPAEFDFGEDDPTTEAGGIWADDLHLTADMHDILGGRLLISMFRDRQESHHMSL